jgi:hypothetical protein
MNRKKIQDQFEQTIKKETGQEVEVTLIGNGRLSVYGTPNAVRLAHTSLLSAVDTLTLTDQETYEEDNEECAFYTF